jgi:hypothetical protein
MKTSLEKIFEEIEYYHEMINKMVREADVDIDRLAFRRHLMIALTEYIKSMAKEGELL